MFFVSKLELQIAFQHQENEIIMSHFLQLLSPFLRKFRTSTPSPTRPSSSASASEAENNEDENENENAVENKREPKKPKSCETDPPTNEKIRLSKATKGIYDL